MAAWKSPELGHVPAADKGGEVGDGSASQGATEVAPRERADVFGGAFLETERRTLAALLPGLDERLAEHPLERLEARDSPAIEIFREAGGANLLIPAEYDGVGASPVEAIRVQRAVGARAPSLAIASTMHCFSLAALLAMAYESDGGLEWMLVQGLAQNKLLVASGFAEGKSGQGIFSPTMRARRKGAKWVISGGKKPCSLAHSMDLLTASCLLEGESGEEEGFGVAIVSAQLPGIEVEPFWKAPVLAGAQSEAVTLHDVELEDELMIRVEEGDGLDTVQTAGMLWFELLMSASYLGMASALAERALASGKADANSKVAVGYELEATMASLESVAHELAGGGDPARLLTRALLCRYAGQDAINRAVAASVEQLGGMAFIGGGEVSYLAAASRALAFHPPPRLRSGDALLDALAGGDLTIG